MQPFYLSTSKSRQSHKASTLPTPYIYLCARGCMVPYIMFLRGTQDFPVHGLYGRSCFQATVHLPQQNQPYSCPKIVLFVLGNGAKEIICAGFEIHTIYELSK